MHEKYRHGADGDQCQQNPDEVRFNSIEFQ
jgi:hypothetical protein